VGVVEAGWLTLGDRYYQALAQSTGRKLALLVGINQYPQLPGLAGCLTDVELQKELLIHRFGFQGSDILTLTQEQASREFIETAFLEHLVKQAQADDVVVFHFSGYGSRVKLEQNQKLQNALITADLVTNSQDKKSGNYLLEETLLLLLRSLNTENAVAILDTSYYLPSTTVGSGIRARQIPLQAILGAEELEFQKQCKQLYTPSDKLLGTILTATSEPKGLARELLFSGFSAGLFTYALTEHLWNTATKIQISSHVANSIHQLGGKQQPGISNIKKQPIVISDNVFSVNSAEGVVTAKEDDGKLHLWLGGLPPQVLEYYGVNSQFHIITNNKPVQIILRSRAGLTAKAQYDNKEITSVQVGQLIQEIVRILPRNINLTVALDTGLERIERVDATSGFSTLPQASAVVAGEQRADYVFAKLPETRIAESTATAIVSPSRYGLFSNSGELIPNTSGEVGEAVKVGVQRLASKVPTLLAAKLWRLTENEGSSRLAVKASLELINNSPRVVMQRETIRTKTGDHRKIVTTETGRIPTVPIGSRIQYRVENMSDHVVYVMLLGLDNTLNAIALYPWQSSLESDTQKIILKDIAIAPGETRVIPQTTAGFEWLIQAPAFLAENQLIFSTAPFTQTIAKQAAKQSGVTQQRIAALLNPVDVAQAVLQDLHNACSKPETSLVTDSYVLDVNHWASFSFIYQIV
jgi:hypothetical protein